MTMMPLTLMTMTMMTTDVDYDDDEIACQMFLTDWLTVCSELSIGMIADAHFNYDYDSDDFETGNHDDYADIYIMTRCPFFVTFYPHVFQKWTVGWIVEDDYI